MRGDPQLRAHDVAWLDQALNPPEKRGHYRKYATPEEAAAGAAEKRRAWSKAHSKDRNAKIHMLVPVRPRAHLTLLHQAGTPGYSLTIPPPAPGSVAFMLLYGERAGGVRA
jgi:hypothetical protein